MASLSLQRVLQTRKTSLEIERENFEKAQSIAINKAINSTEAPVKQKHVRSAIIGTFQQQGGKIFWTIALRLPAMEDRIVAWKLCHVLHKVLREGHPLCLVHSQRHVNDLDEIGKLWGHLKEGYGKMIRLYTKLLMTKLEFHKRNPRFPGHLGVTRDELDSIGANDINNYFQMSVEMFDYLDIILELQAAIFGSLDMSRANSMTSAGQCRLAPLIPCIQDASKLYDYCVRILFRLHTQLPPDTLEGHRDRFLTQFKKLKKFYQNTNNLQYFRDLITVPPLPENPPNFLIQANLHTYVTQEVYVPQEEEEPVEGNLIDMSDLNNSHTAVDRPEPADQNMIAQHIDLIAERDNLIKQLQTQIEKLKTEFRHVVIKNESDLHQLEDKITNLETEIATKESELVQERQVKEDLFHQASAVAQSQDSEQKVKDEKFNKIKDLYVKLREDHINLLRQKADVDKKLTTGNRQLQDLERSKDEIEEKLKEMEMLSLKKEQDLKQSMSKTEQELMHLQHDKELFNMETEVLKKSAEDNIRENNTLKEEIRTLNQIKNGIESQAVELKSRVQVVENDLMSLKSKNQDEIKQIIIMSISENQSILRNAIHEVDNPALSAVVCTPDYFKSLTQGCKESLQIVPNLSYSNPTQLISMSNRIAHTYAMYIIHGRATSNKSPDILFGEKMAEACKQLGESILTLLHDLSNDKCNEEMVSRATNQLENVVSLADAINTTLQGATPANLADLLESEMFAMDKAIEEAANLIQDLLNKSRVANSGIQLEVNEKLLDSCTNLMQAITILIKKSRLLQAEIVAQGKGTASAKEFYKRNHQWTDGFISAAKAVALAAKFLVTAANKVITSQGKLEHMAVAAQEIAASTAQLVVASRVKADRNSGNLKQLTDASKDVTKCTGAVVATVKYCSQLIDEVEDFDMDNLTLHQVKKLEMESQVRILELEKELEQERLRMTSLRRKHYQFTEGEG